jgi:hypothetical protein
MKSLTCAVALVATLATLSCTKEPVRVAVTHKDTYHQVAQ